MTDHEQQSVENAAEAIFNNWLFSPQTAWVKNGNSTKQVEARCYTLACLSSLKASGYRHVTEDFVVVPKEQNSIRCIVYSVECNGDIVWLARCLDYDIMQQGKSCDRAIDHLNLAVKIEDCFDPGLKLFPPSDLKYFTIDCAMIEAAKDE